MKSRTACFTGHRTIAAQDLPMLSKRLDAAIQQMIKEGVVFFGTGMALGFDTLAAQAVLRAKEKHPAVKLIAVLPCTDQDARWKAADRQLYQRILASADKVVYVSTQPYANGCMAARNQHLVQHSGTCIAYLKHKRSGTAQTVRMARECGLTIVNLAEGGDA